MNFVGHRTQERILKLPWASGWVQLRHWRFVLGHPHPEWLVVFQWAQGPSATQLTLTKVFFLCGWLQGDFWFSEAAVQLTLSEEVINPCKPELISLKCLILLVELSLKIELLQALRSADEAESSMAVAPAWVEAGICVLSVIH